LSTANELGRGPLLIGSVVGCILAGDLTGEVIRGATCQFLSHGIKHRRTWVIGILPRIEHTPHVCLDGSCQCPNYRIYLSFFFRVFFHVRIQLVQSLDISIHSHDHVHEWTDLMLITCGQTSN
jgi:hypothetical protein